jgi:hypothetical protein
MRTELKVTALSLAFVLAACGGGTRQEQTAALTDDLKKDLAAASASTDLAIASQSYPRMRFVSAIEQTPTAVPAKRPKVSHHPVRPTVSHNHGSVAITDVAPDPVVAMASKSPEPVSTPAAPTEEAPIAVSQARPHAPSPEPATEPSEGNVGGGDRGHGGGWGGLLGGIIGAVVIRGGHGGVDHCDPRTDGRARPTVIDRPDFGLPLPTGTFPGSRRR